MQNNDRFNWQNFYKAPLVGIIRGLEMEEIMQIAKVYSSAGLYTLEITMNTQNAAKKISALRREFPHLNVGAGTVCTMQDLETALEANAQFIVTPIIDEEVIKSCVGHGIPIFPGAFTPSEIYRAWALGASAVKVFPATQLGPKYIKDVLAPLNDIKLVPTGNISKENIKSFFEAGAVGAGLGSSLINKKLLAAKDYEGLKQYFISFQREIEDFIPNR